MEPSTDPVWETDERPLTEDDLLAELRQLLVEWNQLNAPDRIEIIGRIGGQSFSSRVPTFPHIWVADYPGGRPALRWSQEQQDLPCYCRHCRTPYDRELLNDDCRARDSRTSRRVPCSD